MKRVKIIFTKGGEKGDFLTIIGPDNLHKDVKSERLESGIPSCMLQYVAEDAFGLVGPIKMMAAGIDIDSSATAFARTKMKILCRALEDQIAFPENDIIRFNKTVSEMCKTNGLSTFLLDQASFTEAMQRLRQMRLLVEKLGTGGTFNLSLDI